MEISGVILILIIVFCAFMLVRNEITCNNRAKMIDAIFDYAEDTQAPAEYFRIMSNMESYEYTLYRLWDWGYENILPKADYELIKPYITEK